VIVLSPVLPILHILLPARDSKVLDNYLGIISNFKKSQIYENIFRIWGDSLNEGLVAWRNTLST
jgi:hypothetical protein